MSLEKNPPIAQRSSETARLKRQEAFHADDPAGKNKKGDPGVNLSFDEGKASAPKCCGLLVLVHWGCIPCWPVLLPEAGLRTCWELGGLFFIILELLTLPYRLVFQVPAAGVFALLEDVGILYFLIDIVLNIFTGYNKDGLLITKPGQAMKHYFKGWFWMELIASFPYPWVLPKGGGSGNASGAKVLRILRFGKFLRVLRLLKVAKLRKLYARLEDSFDSLFLAMFALRMSRVLLWLVLLSHFSACAWYLVATTSMEGACYNEPWKNGCSDDSWLSTITIKEDDPSPKIKLYIHSLYFSMATMTTVGYGDISPVSRPEKIFGVFFFLVSIITFSGVVGSVGEVFASFGEQTATMRSELAQLTQYMRWRSLPADTQKKMKDYVQYFWEQNGEQAAHETAILSTFSPNLRQLVVAHVHGPHFKTAPFLSWLTQHDIAFETCLLWCRTELHAPGDFIFTVGEVAQKVYALFEGRVALYEALSNEGAYHSFKYMDMLDQQAFGAEDEDDKKGPKKSSIDSVQLLERRKPEDEECQFGGSCVVQLAFGPDEPAGKVARLRPYSARCQSHCVVVSLSVDNIKKTMDRFPFLWDEFHYFLQKQGVLPHCTNVPWGGKSGGKTLDAEEMGATGDSKTPGADQARYNSIKKEMAYIEARLEELSRNYLSVAKGYTAEESMDEGNASALVSVRAN